MVEPSLASRDTILILGAGIDQSYAIRMAHEMGLRVLAADVNPKAPGFYLADETAIVSNRDIAGLKKILDESAKKGNPVSGILVMGADIPFVAAELALHLNVPGPSINTGIWASDKFLMKERLSHAGVKVPWYSKVDSYKHLKLLLRQQQGGKFVIKPTNRSGSRGVFLVDSEKSEIKHLYYKTLKEANGGPVLLERYIEGDQVSTESILWNGHAYTPGFADRNYEMLQTYSPHFIENGGITPSLIRGKKKEQIKSLVEKAALALGIKYGIAKGDVVLAADGTPMIIEMAARLSGGDFSESLIPIGTGVNIVKAAITIALGKKLKLESIKVKYNKTVANRYFFGSPGRLVKIEGLKSAQRIPWVKKIQVFVKPGDTIKPIKSHSGRLGVFIVTAKNRRELSKRILRIYKLVKFKILK